MDSFCCYQVYGQFLAVAKCMGSFFLLPGVWAVSCCNLVHGQFHFCCQVYLHAVMLNVDTQATVYHAPTALDLLLDFPRSLYHHTDPILNTGNKEVKI